MNKIKVSLDGNINSIEDAIRVSRVSNCKEIYIESGFYFNQHINLDERDNGLKITGDICNPPVLSGGILIDGFKVDAETGFFYKQLKNEYDYDFRMLIANGKYLNKSRYPSEDTLSHETIWSVRWTSTFGNGWEREPTLEELTTMQFKNGDFDEDFDYRNAELVIYHEWDESFVSISEYDYKNSKFVFEKPCGHPPGSFGNQTYAVFNTKLGMKKELSWYWDKKKNIIYINPDETMTAENLQVHVPVNNSVINMKNVQDIFIESLQFTECTAPLIAAQFGAQMIPGAIDIEGGYNVSLENISVKNSGGMGVKANGIKINVTNSCFYNLGAGGIWLGINDDFLFKREDEIEKGCSSKIEECTVEKTGIDFYASIAVFGRHADIINNSIKNAPYMGINAGGNGVLVEKNIVSNVMKKLNDGAAIYTIGYTGGTIRGNIIRDIKRSERHDSKKSAIYLDENSGQWTVEKNIIIECDYPFFCHMTREGNLFVNNVALSENSHEINILCLRSKLLSFENNIIKCNNDIIFHLTSGAIETINSNYIDCLNHNLMVYKYNEYVQVGESIIDLIDIRSMEKI